MGTTLQFILLSGDSMSFYEPIVHKAVQANLSGQKACREKLLNAFCDFFPIKLCLYTRVIMPQSAQRPTETYNWSKKKFLWIILLFYSFVNSNKTQQYKSGALFGEMKGRF